MFRGELSVAWHHCSTGDLVGLRSVVDQSAGLVFVEE